MIETATLLTFVPAALALNLTPGADMMFCLGQGLRSGPRAATAASGALRGGAVPAELRRVPARRAFRSGLAVNLANPKVILFVLAFVPQFVDPAAGPVLAQFMALGAVLALGGFVINAAVGLFAGGAGRRLTGSPAASRWAGRISGGIFAALALRLAIMERV